MTDKQDFTNPDITLTFVGKDRFGGDVYDSNIFDVFAKLATGPVANVFRKKED